MADVAVADSDIQWKPAIHIIGLPHTIVSNEFSTCAFTGKVLRFSKMMRQYGWVIHEYSNEGSESDANYHHVVLSREEFDKLRDVKEKDELFDEDVNNQRLRSVYWQKVYELIKEKSNPYDIVCHVFGPRYELCAQVPECFHIESGIGYTCEFGKLDYRVFETNAWMHWHYGRHHESQGQNYNWVVPNYYDIDEWEVTLEPKGDEKGQYILFFGRLISTKGLQTIVEIAKRMPEERFVICGPGDPEPWLEQADNIEYHPPVIGNERSEFVGNSKCMLMPTLFIEPFGGSGAEAQICGVPLIGINYGAFIENIEDGKSGYLCNTLADWVESIKRIDGIDRQYVADRARSLWSLETVGAQYNVVFNQLADQRGNGWYSEKSHKIFWGDEDAEDGVADVDRVSVKEGDVEKEKEVIE